MITWYTTRDFRSTMNNTVRDNGESFNDVTFNFGCEQQRRQQSSTWDNAFVHVNSSNVTTTTTAATATARRTRANVIDVWRSFIRMIDTLSQLSDRTSQNRRNVESPRIGDIAFYVARVIAESKFNTNDFLTYDAVNDNSTINNNNNNNNNCDYDGLMDNNDDGIALIHDFFILNVREFTTRYLNDLVERYDIETREKIFAVKIWLTCRVHFDHQLTKRLKKMSSPTLSSNNVRVTDRLIFIENKERSTDILRVETFSPTFAMYTVCDLRDPYDRTINTDSNRFDDDNDARDDNRATDNGKRRIVGAPPSKQNWINLMPSGNRIVWYVQNLVLNARETVNRDRTLMRFIERSLNNNNNNDDVNSGGSNDSMVVATDELNCSGVRTFANSVKYEQEYQSYAKNHDLSSVDCFSVYKTLLDDLAIQWAKLNVFEPNIFE